MGGWHCTHYGAFCWHYSTRDSSIMQSLEGTAPAGSCYSAWRLKRSTTKRLLQRHRTFLEGSATIKFGMANQREPSSKLSSRFCRDASVSLCRQRPRCSKLSTIFMRTASSTAI